MKTMLNKLLAITVGITIILIVFSACASATDAENIKVNPNGTNTQTSIVYEEDELTVYKLTYSNSVLTRVCYLAHDKSYGAVSISCIP